MGKTIKVEQAKKDANMAEIENIMKCIPEERFKEMTNCINAISFSEKDGNFEYKQNDANKETTPTDVKEQVRRMLVNLKESTTVATGTRSFKFGDIRVEYNPFEGTVQVCNYILVGVVILFGEKASIINENAVHPDFPKEDFIAQYTDKNYDNKVKAITKYLLDTDDKQSAMKLLDSLYEGKIGECVVIGPEEGETSYCFYLRLNRTNIERYQYDSRYKKR